MTCFNVFGALFSLQRLLISNFVGF